MNVKEEVRGAASPGDTGRFLAVTEFAGQKISQEQLERTCHRYHWAASFCGGKDVIELACGGGQGLGLLAQQAKSVRGGDISPEVLARARATYGDEIPLDVFPADAIPLPAESLDVVLLFEAIYYLSDPGAFVAEARRVLRRDGLLLIVTANKDLFDFTPSPASTRYFGVVELERLLNREGFDPRFWGYVDVSRISLRQRIFRPIKYLVSRLGLMPKSMDGKSFLKRIVFGAMTTMPGRIDAVPFEHHEPTELPSDAPSFRHKVLYCAARKG